MPVTLRAKGDTVIFSLDDQTSCSVTKDVQLELTAEPVANQDNGQSKVSFKAFSSLCTLTSGYIFTQDWSN